MDETDNLRLIDPYQSADPSTQDGALDFSPRKSTFDERMEEEDKGYRVPDVRRTALPEFAIPIAEEALAFNGKKALKPQELIQLGSDVVNGKTGWIALQTKDENGVVKNSFGISQNGKVVSANEITRSLEKYGKQIEGASGSNVARIVAEEVSTLFTSRLGIPQDPINSKPMVMKVATQSLVTNGLLTAEEEAAGYDPDNVEVSVAVSPSVMGKAVLGGVEAWANGVPKPVAFAGVTAAIAEMPEFKKAGPKQKMFMLDRAYDSFLKGASAKADEVNVKAATDQIEANKTAVQGIKGTVEDGTARTVLIPLSTASRESKQRENVRLSAALNKVRNDSVTAQNNVKAAGAELVEQLRALDVNVKGLEEELRTGEDSSQAMIEQINRLDPSVRAQALAAYQGFKASMSQAVTGADVVISEITERMAQNNGEIANGIALDYDKMYDVLGGMSQRAVAEIMEDPKKYSQFLDDISIQNPETMVGLSQRDYEIQRDKHAQMLVLNRAFDRMVKGQSEGMRGFFETKRQEFAKAIKDGKLQDMEGGQDIIDGANQAVAYAEQQASYRPKSDYAAFTTALNNNVVVYGGVGVDLESVVKGKNPEGVTVEAVKKDLTAQYSKYGDAFLKNFLGTFDAKVKEIEGKKAVQEAAKAVTPLTFGGGIPATAFDIGRVLVNRFGRQEMAPAPALQSFTSAEEADKAGLPAGTIVLINGRRAQIN